jgi:hypothetical protein
MLTIVFKGVLMSWEVEAIMISDSFSKDLLYSFVTSWVISSMIIILANYESYITSFYFSSYISILLSPEPASWSLLIQILSWDNELILMKSFKEAFFIYSNALFIGPSRPGGHSSSISSLILKHLFFSSQCNFVDAS